jgi:hypothetical protein
MANEHRLQTRDHTVLDYIVGFIAYKAADKYTGPCWGAAQIVNSAANQGYGPLMYDMAMYRAGVIMSDRYSVSAQARNVWDKYDRARGDVHKFPLDDIRNPKTPPPDDDCILRHGSISPMNNAYGSDGIDPAPLVANHTAFMYRLHDEGLTLASEDVEHLLADAGNTFFDIMHGESQ